jgi:hypothetical protein
MRRRLLSHGCGGVACFERENAEESPSASAFSNTEMMNKFK